MSHDPTSAVTLSPVTLSPVTILDGADWPDLGAARDRQGVTAGPPALDVERLIGRCLGNHDFAVRVLRKFATRFGDDFRELEKTVQAGDAGQVGQVAHRLKGACANAAATVLQQSAGEIEDLARQQDLEEIRDRLDRLQDAWNDFLAMTRPADLPTDPRTRLD